jgi:hypothetical protein
MLGQSWAYRRVRGDQWEDCLKLRLIVRLLDLEISMAGGGRIKVTTKGGSRRFRRVAGTAQDREARIFWKLRIRLRELAEEVLRAEDGGDKPRVETIRAEAAGGGIRFSGIGGHAG